MSEPIVTQLKSKFNKKTIQDIDVGNKRLLVRVDYNVPLDKESHISDDGRIRASLPTINYLLDHQAKVILCSHFGRPQGKVVDSLRLVPVAKRLSELLNMPVTALGDCTGPEVERAVSRMKAGDIVLLENLRFHPGEEANDPGFARSLAGLAEIYVNDAFGSSHRAHASVTGVTRCLPAVAGLLMKKELDFVGQLLENPAHPFVAVVGGAKVSDKLTVIRSILDKVDVLLIGGGMAASFLRVQGCGVGASAVEEDELDYIKEVLAKAKAKGVRLLLPTDVVVCQKLEADVPYQVASVKDIPVNWVIADIGLDTIKKFVPEIRRARTAFWNGPMGIFEIRLFSAGTKSIARALADSQATTIVGGGSTAEVVKKLGLADKMTHISTGGGASLECLEGKGLPGVSVLQGR